uniref:Uncharacterized protein n=1 Tax=Oryza meridionalis TaxID=40149 RepID=A0A0E0ES95_9ORYZ
MAVAGWLTEESAEARTAWLGSQSEPYLVPELGFRCAEAAASLEQAATTAPPTAADVTRMDLSFAPLAFLGRRRLTPWLLQRGADLCTYRHSYRLQDLENPSISLRCLV